MHGARTRWSYLLSIEALAPPNPVHGNVLLDSRQQGQWMFALQLNKSRNGRNVARWHAGVRFPILGQQAKLHQENGMVVGISTNSHGE